MVADHHPILRVLEFLHTVYRPRYRIARRPGRPGYPPHVFVFITVVVVLKQIRSIRALHRYLQANPKVRAACDLEGTPSRWTLARHLKDLRTPLRQRIKALTKRYLKDRQRPVRTTAIDSSIFAADGPLWHASDRRKGRVPDRLRGVDVESSWGVTGGGEWKQGYKLHVLVSADAADEIPWPLDAFPSAASANDAKVALRWLRSFPPELNYLLGDRIYATAEFIDHVQERHYGCYITRRLISPIAVYANTSPERKAFARYCNSPAAQRRWRCRGPTVERFYSSLHQTFNLDPLWMKGRRYTTMLRLAGVLTYQVLVLWNLSNGSNSLAFKEILDVI